MHDMLRLSCGFIPWNYVEGVQEHEIGNEKFIAIFVNNPKVFIEAGSKKERKQKRAIMELMGTPINIQTSLFEVSHKEFVETLKQYHRIALQKA